MDDKKSVTLYHPSPPFPSSSMGGETGIVSRLARSPPAPAAVQRAKQPGASRRGQEGEAHRCAYSVRRFACVPRPQGARGPRHPARASERESSSFRRRRRCQKSCGRGSGQQEGGGGVHGGGGGGGGGGGFLGWRRYRHPAGRGERDDDAVCPLFLRYEWLGYYSVRASRLNRHHSIPDTGTIHRTEALSDLVSARQTVPGTATIVLNRHPPLHPPSIQNAFVLYGLHLVPPAFSGPSLIPISTTCLLSIGRHHTRRRRAGGGRGRRDCQGRVQHLVPVAFTGPQYNSPSLLLLVRYHHEPVVYRVSKTLSFKLSRWEFSASYTGSCTLDVAFRTVLL